MDANIGTHVQFQKNIRAHTHTYIHSGKLINSSNLIIRRRDLGRFAGEVIVPVIVAQSS